MQQLRLMLLKSVLTWMFNYYIICNDKSSESQTQPCFLEQDTDCTDQKKVRNSPKSHFTDYISTRQLFSYTRFFKHHPREKAPPFTPVIGCETYIMCACDYWKFALLLGAPGRVWIVGYQWTIFHHSLASTTWGKWYCDGRRWWTNRVWWWSSISIKNIVKYAYISTRWWT